MLLLAGFGAKHLVKRYIQQMPADQSANYQEAFEAKKADLRTKQWQDSRPLIILAGDSHIEMGNWYDAFRGALAIRNSGLSRSKISDVTSLISEVSDKEIDIMLLHCGINDILNGSSPEECIEDYTKLLDQATALRPKRIIVMSVMPVRQSPVDGWSPDTNDKVRRFNSHLALLCSTREIEIIHPVKAVADDGGGLKEDFTFDGLHLNIRGYAAIEPLVFEALMSKP